jgi:hypothetical protein
MISSADILHTHVYLARRFRWRMPIVIAGIDEALREAEALAVGRPEDEPAALLFALLRRPMDLRDAWERLPFVLAENLLRQLGAEIRLDPLAADVQALRMRVIARDPTERATLDDVRAFLAERTRRP